MGIAWTVGLGAGSHECRASRHRVSRANPGAERPVERSNLHGPGVPAGVLSQVSRLLRLFPAVGAGGLSESFRSRGGSLTLNVVGVVCALASEARHLGPATRRYQPLTSLADGTLL